MASAMEEIFTRRAFIQRASALAFAMPTLRGSGSGRATVLRIGIIDGADADRLDGAQLGVEEARHAAALFGGDIQLTKIAEGGASPFAIIIGDGDAERCARLARAALLMNVSCTTDALRGAQCAPALFHVAPSEAMLRDGRSASDDEAVAWDASLERFGADTLNQRFQSRFGRPMSA